METLPFLYMMKAPNSTIADLYVLNRGAGWLRFRSAGAKGRDEKAAAWGGGVSMPKLQPFDDLIHIAHVTGITY